MVKQIFVNLPVADVAKSRAFFERIGFRIDERFTDGNAVCVAFSDTIYAMLLSREMFSTFTDKKIADTGTDVEALLAL
jgi:uncharacterized protein